MDHRLVIHQAQKAFADKAVLNDIQFTLKTGEILGLFGANGAGKSTLLKLLFGTLAADQLDYDIDGVPIKGHDGIRKQWMGYLPQDSLLPRRMKVRDIIPIFFKEEAAQELLFRAPFIEKIAATNVGELSMGERRYFELLLIGNLSHPFLFLDEPFSMIEPLYREAIQGFLDALKATKGILITDHYYADVLEVSDRKLLLKDGLLYPIESNEDLKKLGYLK